MISLIKIFIRLFIVYFSSKMSQMFVRRSMPEAFIIKLVKVPVEFTLFEVVNALKGDLQTILSCFRVYKYADQEIGEDVFVSIRDIFEYKDFKEKESILIGNVVIKLEFDIWRFGAASSSFDAIIGPLVGPKPVALKISNINTVSRITTYYLMKLLTAFESFANRDITGLTLLYDVFRHEIRPFGFVTFNSELGMMRFNKQSVRIFDEIINCEASNRVPILVNEENQYLLDPFPVNLTQQLCDANLLNQAPLARCESNISLTLGMEELNLNDMNINNDEMVIDENSLELNNDMSDTESILSIELSYDFDDNFNLINKN